jgi:uncharacterized membrane-anchored protein YitT (DUF2179 family)
MYYLKKTGVVFISIGIDFFLVPFEVIHPIISLILGGIVIGIGVGMMLSYESSTGGTNLLAQIYIKVINLNYSPQSKF